MNSKKKIMLVEDEQIIAMSYRAALKKAGFNEVLVIRRTRLFFAPDIDANIR
ncbi:MAG: hypothetical protein PF693_18435 [Spirochaetia bacterium]|nr:hypothetical protein [Spirochaetia bacterium]